MLKKFEIQTKQILIVVFIICLLSIALIVFLGIKSNDDIQNIVQKQFNERQLLLSKQISSGISEFLNEKTTIIEVMALHISDESPDDILNIFKDVYHKTSDIYVFEFINESGIVTIGYPEENTPFGYDLYKNKRPHDNGSNNNLNVTFEWVRDKKETNITKPITLLEGGLGTFIWTPVYKGDKFQGVVLSIIRISDISNKFLKNYEHPWEIHMVDERGIILYNTSDWNKDGVRNPEAQNDTDILIQQIYPDQINGKEGYGYYFENNKSEKKLIAYSPISWFNQNWSIYVISSESEVKGLINSVFLKQGLIIGIAVGLILLGSFSIILLISRWNRKLEFEVAKKTGELNESNILLQDANEKLKEIDKLKSNFLSMISHELRTPLTAMKISSELLLEDKKKPIDRNELIQILARNIDRLTRLVNNLLNISMIESGKMKYNMEKVDLHEIIDIAVGTTKNQYETKGLNITVDVPENLSKINADKDRIIQVFLNLLSNAMKFTHEGGNVQIRSFEYEKYIEVHVKDDGVGIPSDKIDKIFSNFYQIDNSSTRSYGGAGLGLAISKSIMESHGGSIIVKSIPSKGSEFILTFKK
jgi:signal transduction histidine kinase